VKVDPQKPNEEEKEIQFYWNNHVETFQMVTTYTTDVRTWKGEHPEQKNGEKPVILVQCDHFPKTENQKENNKVYISLLC
jgi:hypothetical protein